MKFVGIIIYLFAILKIVLTLKIEKKRQAMSPVDILTQIRLFRSKKNFLKSAMKNVKGKEWAELDKSMMTVRENLKSLRLKFAIKNPLSA